MRHARAPRDTRYDDRYTDPATNLAYPDPTSLTGMKDLNLHPTSQLHATCTTVHALRGPHSSLVYRLSCSGALCGFGDITSRGDLTGWSEDGIETTEDLGGAMDGGYTLSWQAGALGSVTVTSSVGTTCAGAAWADSQVAEGESVITC